MAVMAVVVVLHSVDNLVVWPVEVFISVNADSAVEDVRWHSGRVRPEETVETRLRVSVVCRQIHGQTV